MPPRSLHARLVLSLLLILLPVLGGGGLFWFRGETRHLQAEFDLGLSGLAGKAMFLLQNPPANQPQVSSCFALRPFFSRLGPGEGAALFSGEGELLCRTGTIEVQQEFDASSLRAQLQGGRSLYRIHTVNETSLRSVSLPIFRAGEISEILVVSRDYEVLLTEQRRLAWSLGILVVLALCSAVAMAWLVIRQQLRPLSQLAQWIGELRKTRVIKERPASSGATTEVLQLQEAVADLLTGLASDLSRARQFTADASHELRTPLTILRGETEVALRWAQDPEETRKVLASNLEEIDRMSRIIEDLLLLSKSEVGEMPLQFERFDLRQLLEEMHQQAQLLGEKKEIAVRFESSDLARQRVLIQGDPLRLRQLFLNLLTNAVKYTGVGGNVELKLVQLGSLVEVRVKDSGIGIAAKHHSQIFDRFFRVDKARNREDGGSGLGLSIAQWVAESHGGHIKVYSEPGRGSEFVVVLPLEKEMSGRL